MRTASLRNGVVRSEWQNEGEAAQEEVVQIYVQATEDKDETLHPHLAVFRRICVPAGERVLTEMEVPKTAWTVVRKDGKREKAVGGWKLFVGTHQPDAQSVSLSGTNCVCLCAASKEA